MISDPPELSFDDLIAPFGRDEFFNKVHGKEPVHIAGPAKKFDFAMTWDQLSILINQSGNWSSRSLQLALDTQEVPAREYCTPSVNREGTDAMMVDIERLGHWLGRGASMILNNMSTLTPGMSAIANVLGAETGGKVSCNIYCSWKAHQAFTTHFDCHDVFAMQIDGEKRWRIYQRHFKNPINHPEFRQLDEAFHNQHKGPVSTEFVMKPGDMVYIPRGYYHDALAESDGTVHMTFSVVPPVGLDMISAVYERAIYEDVFRQAIPHPSVDGGKAIKRHMMRLAGRFRELAREPEFQKIFFDRLSNFADRHGHIKLPDDALKK